MKNKKAGTKYDKLIFNEPYVLYIVRYNVTYISHIPYRGP